jgi:hypothetical protein
MELKVLHDRWASVPTHLKVFKDALTIDRSKSYQPNSSQLKNFESTRLLFGDSTTVRVCPICNGFVNTIYSAEYLSWLSQSRWIIFVWS